MGHFAAELNRKTETLIEQLASAGIEKSTPDDRITEDDKKKLLDYLRAQHSSTSPDRKKITLTRKR